MSKVTEKIEKHLSASNTQINEELSAWQQALKDSKPVVNKIQKDVDYLKKLPSIKEPTTTKLIGTLKNLESQIKQLRKILA